MADTQSTYAVKLRQAGFVPVYTISLVELLEKLDRTAPETPLKPIFFWSRPGSLNCTIAVDELGYQWIYIARHVDLTHLGFRDTTKLTPQLHLEHDSTKKN